MAFKGVLQGGNVLGSLECVEIVWALAQCKAARSKLLKPFSIAQPDSAPIVALQ